MLRRRLVPTLRGEVSSLTDWWTRWWPRQEKTSNGARERVQQAAPAWRSRSTNFGNRSMAFRSARANLNNNCLRTKAAAPTPRRNPNHWRCSGHLVLAQAPVRTSKRRPRRTCRRRAWAFRSSTTSRTLSVHRLQIQAAQQIRCLIAPNPSSAARTERSRRSRVSPGRWVLCLPVA